jgi:transcriptional regulator of acetoin/glycerol metabolism
MTETVTVTYGDATAAPVDDLLAPSLIVALECQRPLGSSARSWLAQINEVTIGRGAKRRLARPVDATREPLRIEVPDRWMSSLHARLLRRGADWFVEDAGAKNGTFVNGERASRVRLADGDRIEAGSTLFLFQAGAPRAPTEPLDIDAAAAADAQPASLTTLSPALRRQFDNWARIASSPVPALVLGETGTGKELAAQALHALSARAGEFVAVNCGALPQHLVESELFGHRKGAFTDAVVDHPGLIRAAHLGTLFFDEIAELPEPSQVALLRVLQEREVRPVGDTRSVQVDTRIVAATHQDLEARVAAGSFRQDLYARLAGFRLRLPPLRERREDLGVLIAALLPRVAGDRSERIRFRRSAARALFAYPFPLNIRELEHALRSAIALCEHDEIAPEHLPEAMRGDSVGTGLRSRR